MFQDGESLYPMNMVATASSEPPNDDDTHSSSSESAEISSLDWEPPTLPIAWATHRQIGVRSLEVRITNLFTLSTAQRGYSTDNSDRG